MDYLLINYQLNYQIVNQFGYCCWLDDYIFGYQLIKSITSYLINFHHAMSYHNFHYDFYHV